MANIIVFRIAAVSVSGFGILVNVLTMVLFLCSHRLRTPINFFLMILAFWDSSTLLLYLLNSATQGDDMGKGVLNHGKACTAQGSLFFLLCHLSISCIMMTSAMRYVHIVHPQMSKTYTTWRNCGVASVVILVEGLVVMWPLWTRWGKITYMPAVEFCSFQWSYNLVYSGFVFGLEVLLPNLLVTYFYIGIFQTHQRSKRRIQIQGSIAGPGGGIKKKDLMLTLQIFVIFTLFCVTWGPLFVTYWVLDVQSVDNATLYHVLGFLLAINSTANPFVYLIFNGTFRREGKRLLLCCKGTESVSIAVVVSTETSLTPTANTNVTAT